MNYNTTGEILQDIKNGKEQPFQSKKLKSLKVSDSFYRIGFDKKALRIKLCGNNLNFKVCTKDNYKKLVGADFCRERLCVMCNWRRSKKLYSDILLILHRMQEIKQFKFIFLTLTVRNCMSDDLSETIDLLYKSIKLFHKYKDIDKVIKGYVQVLEITHDTEKLITSDMYNGNELRHIKSRKGYYDNLGLYIGDLNPNYDTYHPHFHILIAVNPSYFQGTQYLDKETWTNYWQKALKVDYKPIIDVQVIKARKERSSIESAVAETSKYAVKDSDYISEDCEEMDNTILVLNVALKGRRLISFGKLCKTIKAELKIQDVESIDVDLVQADSVGCTCPICGSDLIESIYRWNIGLSQYLEVDNG